MGIRGKFIGILLVIALVVGGVTYGLLLKGHTDLINMEAGRIADIVTTQVIADRAIYTRDLVGKLKQDGVGASREYHENEGYIMLPAQFVRTVAQRVDETAGDLYRYRLLSEWNLNEDQGLKDDFDQYAWQELVRQNSEFLESGPAPANGYPWKSISRIETVNGKSVLQYLRADPASATSCVTCHNGYEQRPEIIAMREKQGVASGKEWKPNELMGALRVDIPLETVEAAAEKSRQVLLAGVGITFFLGFAALLGMLYLSVVVPIEKSVHEVKAFGSLVDSVVKHAAQLLEGAENQADILANSDDKFDKNQIRKMANENASVAELAAASCGQLDNGFKNLNLKFQRMLGKKE